MSAPSAERSEFAARLAQARQLRFPPELESRYEADTGPERSRLLVERGILGIALFIAYLGIDWLITPDSFALAVALRLGIVVPLAAICLVITHRNPPMLLREGLPVLVCLVGAATTIVVMSTSQGPLRDYHHFSLVLMVLYLSLVLPIRFRLAAVAAGGLVAIDLTGILLVPALSPAVVAIDLAILLASCLLALMAARTFEQNMRLAYLLGQSQRVATERLEELNRHDPLTGLGNRRALDETILRLAANPPTGDIAVIVADIDHFKSYNDSLGHPAGDTCLKRIAALLAAELRAETDLAVRFGGEEFVMLMPSTDLWTAITVAERMRLAVAAAGLPHPGRPLGGAVTVSLGVAAGRIGGTVVLDELIQSADSALYAAKNAGRNQVWPRPRAGSDVVAIGSRRSGAA